MSNPSREDTPLTRDEFLHWAEFAAWTMSVLAPVLYYLNGPSVSSDQFVVRAALMTVAVASATALRIVNWRRGR